MIDGSGLNQRALQPTHQPNGLFHSHPFSSRLDAVIATNLVASHIAKRFTRNKCGTGHAPKRERERQREGKREKGGGMQHGALRLCGNIYMDG